MSPYESELRELIRRLQLNDDRLLSVNRRVVAIGQGVRDLQAFGGSPITNIVSASLNLQVVGCLATPTPLPNSTIDIVGHTTGNDYGSHTLAAGTLALTLFLDPADTSLDFYAGGPGVRFGTAPVDTRALTTSLISLSAFPASGYHCHPLWNYPINDSLVRVDSVYGTRTQTWAVVGSDVGHFGPPTSITAAASGLCPGGSTTLTEFFGRVSTRLQYRLSSAASGTLCPGPGGGPTTLGAADALLTVTTAPTATAKLDLIWNIPGTGSPANQLYGGSSATVRIFEP